MCPGESSGVFFPAILKSWESLPLLVMVKITAPEGTLRFDSVNLESVATTVTRVVAFEWDAAAAPELAPPPGTKIPKESPAPAIVTPASTATNTRFLI